MIRRNHRTFVFLLLTALVQACALAPASSPVPTFDPNSISTSIVQTANAAATQTALIVSSTPLPTDTPTPTLTSTPSPTATFIFILSTPTVPSNTPVPGSSGLKFDCQILLKNPADDSHMAANSNFTMVWTVMNMGTDLWDSNNADYRFRSGDKIHKVAAYDLESSVPTGGQIEIMVAMKSPQSAGTYSTTWVIKSGQTEFCRMGIRIKVP